MATLWIGLWYSHCGECGGNADLSEDKHENKTMQGEGCGAEYDGVACSYLDFENCCEKVRKMRPDLEWRGYV